MFQLYEQKTPVSRIETCVNDMKLWAGKNNFALDDSKAMVIQMSYRFCFQTLISY